MEPEDLEFKAHFSEAIEGIKKGTIQILHDGNWEAKGSGVLATDGNHHFLITAAHVVEHKLYSLYVRSGLKRNEESEVIKIQFDSFINKSPERAKDKIDIAILKLYPATVEKLVGHYGFIDISELWVNHEFNPGDLYAGVGFPATMTKRNPKTRKITAQSTFIQFPAAEEEIYTKLECNSAANILLFYPKNKMISFETDLPGTAPDLNGMSGGGLWKLLYNSEQQIQRKLVGILTEWSDKRKTNYVISTRIDVVSELLRSVFSVDVEQSETFKATFNIESAD
jgi:hypothetical protein